MTLVNGKFVGTTYYGGSSDHGTVYTLTPTGEYHVLYSFKGSPDGYGPGGIIVYDGNYYGFTNRGGAYGGGAVFEITPSGEEHVVYSFGRGKDGSFPVGMILYDGKFYGTTYYGGGIGAGWGAAFEVGPSGQERVLHRFGAAKDDYAGTPGGDLTELNGMLYGTAGTSKHGYGTIFSLTTSGRYENVHTFTGREGGPGVIWSYRGALYGTTDGEYVGKQHFTFYRGAFFEMRLPHDFRVITRLGDLLDRPGALLPIDGAFYLRIGDGPYKNGDIYKLTLSGDVSLLCWFKLQHGHNDGQHNGVGLSYQGDSLYGESLWGGPQQAGGGTVLKVTP